MGDRETLAKAKKELEDLYLGVPDESVNLTFQDLAQLRPENKKLSPPPPSPLAKLPSLDFSRGLDNTNHHHHRAEDERSFVYDDMSVVERGGRRRPGIPHSNICTVCSNYVYIFRHRCLVCGRAYCRQCVTTGMGDMTEGRKCLDCLGKRFSQRYIHKAGNVGCCMGYPSLLKQQELKWAEKGPRRSGGNRYGNSVMMSRSRSPVGPSNPPSFVMTSPYSPYSPKNHHPMPF